MTKPPNKPDKEALNRLDMRLKRVRGLEQDPLDKTKQTPPPKGGPLGLAFRVSIEIVSAVVIGVVIGWLADEWFGTRPWLMLVFIVLGGSAGILNVYRMAAGFGYEVGYKREQTNFENIEPDER